MKNTIERPTLIEIDALRRLFTISINHAFKTEGLEDLDDEINYEIEEKVAQVKEDLKSKGKNRYFLVAKLDDKIVGAISYGQTGSTIKECTNGELNNVGEMGTLYVLPEYHGMGIGSKLIYSILEYLTERNIELFCFDSGYKTAQSIWTHKFGEPKYIITDYWGEGIDHMIWLCHTEAIMSNWKA